MMLPDEFSFPNGPGLVDIDIGLNDVLGRQSSTRPPPRRVRIMSESEPRANIDFETSAISQAENSISGPNLFLGDPETSLPDRETLRFCKSSKLIALELTSSEIVSTDVNVIPATAPVSADISINEVDNYRVSPGQVVRLRDALPIGAGIALAITVPPPGVAQWPVNSAVNCSIALHIECP